MEKKIFLSVPISYDSNDSKASNRKKKRGKKQSKNTTQKRIAKTPLKNKTPPSLFLYPKCDQKKKRKKESKTK
jgi:membrane protein insertase Oxa1/YidC/SpoIIIJ